MLEWRVPAVNATSAAAADVSFPFGRVCAGRFFLCLFLSPLQFSSCLLLLVHAENYTNTTAGACGTLDLLDVSSFHWFVFLLLLLWGNRELWIM